MNLGNRVRLTHYTPDCDGVDVQTSSEEACFVSAEVTAWPTTGFSTRGTALTGTASAGTGSLASIVFFKYRASFFMADFKCDFWTTTNTKKKKLN